MCAYASYWAVVIWEESKAMRNPVIDDMIEKGDTAIQAAIELPGVGPVYEFMSPVFYGTVAMYNNTIAATENVMAMLP